MVTTRAGANPGVGSRPLPVDRRMPLLTLTVRAAFAWEAPMRADDARGEPDRHLARLELSAEREHLLAASPSSGPRQADSDWARPRPQSYYASCSAANRPGRAPSGLSHSERLAGLGLLAERLRYRFRVVRHVHHTLFVDPLIELTPMRRGLIAGAGCCRGWSRRGRACRRIGDPHPVVREGYTVATKLVPSSRILNGEACKRNRLGARPRNHDGTIGERSGEPRRIVGGSG